MDRVIIRDLVEALDTIEQLPGWSQTADHLRTAVGEAFDFALPLVFQRGRTDDEHTLHAQKLAHDLGGGDTLDRLAEAHFIADQASAGAGREESSLALVLVEGHAEQLLERGAVDAARESLVHQLAAPLRIADLGHEAERILLAAQIVILA